MCNDGTADFKPAPVLIGLPERALPAFERMAAEKMLPPGMIAVPLSDDLSQLPGDLKDVEVLWRTTQMGSDWTLRAVSLLPSLRWVHSDAVGIDFLPLEELSARQIILSNGSGNFERPMAEWCVLAILAASKQLARFVRQSDAGIWKRGGELEELEGKRLLILGLGGVGTLTASMVRPFGMRVTAVSRRPRDRVPEGVDSVVGPSQWRERLDHTDFLVCALPLTSQTRGMLDEQVFSALPSSAWVINVARGALIDESALITALDSTAIAGAVLDAFVEEPLPPEHPLWRRDNVLVLPHHTWSSKRVPGRILELFADQLGRWSRGEPLRNVVDLSAGY